MTNVRFPSIDDYRDIETLNMYRQEVVERGTDPARVMAAIHAKGRDNARTPMQWSDRPNAGFTAGTPWIKVNPNYREINVAQAVADPDSIFHYYRRLIRLRKEQPVIVYGRYEPILDEHRQIYAFLRVTADERLLVILNFTPQWPVFEAPATLHVGEASLLIANYPVDESQDIRHFTLRPWEARVYRLRA